MEFRAMRWVSIPWGRRLACLASAGRSPWHGNRSLAALKFGCLLAFVFNIFRVDAVYTWCLQALVCSISGVVKLVDRLESHPGALNSSWTLTDVVLAKSFSALG